MDNLMVHISGFRSPHGRVVKTGFSNGRPRSNKKNEIGQCQISGFLKSSPKRNHQVHGLKSFEDTHKFAQGLLSQTLVNVVFRKRGPPHPFAPLVVKSENDLARSIFEREFLRERFTPELPSPRNQNRTLIDKSSASGIGETGRSRIITKRTQFCRNTLKMDKLIKTNQMFIIISSNITR